MTWIEFLLRLRTANMPIGKMQAFAKLRRVGDATVADCRQMLEEHLKEVLSKIEHYRSVEQSLMSDSLSDEGQTDEH